jgi:hypothetical protein
LGSEALMSVIETIRPSGGSAETWGVQPPGNSIHAVVTDNNDATYAYNFGLSQELQYGYPAHTPPANHQRHQARQRVRARNSTAVGAGLYSSISHGGGIFNNINYATDTVASEKTGPWYVFPGLATAGAVSLIQYHNFVTSSDILMNLLEVYYDIDCRHKPIFDADVLKLDGTSAAGGVVDDTFRPRFTFSVPEYDGLGARSWLFAVKQGGTVIHTESGDGPPPSQTDPFLILPNGSYVAEFQVFSTIRNDEAFSSDVVSISFTVDYEPEESLITAVYPDCNLGGYVVSVLIQGEAIEDMSVVRHDYTTGGLTPVRGLIGLPPNTALEIVDYEAPLDHEIGYFLYAGTGIPIDPPPIQEEIFPSAWFRDVCDPEQMYLRWLFQPGMMTSEFCLGPIGELGYQPRSGVFPVIGRSDPVVVSDQQETSRGTLRLIGRTTQEVEGLRKLLTKNAQPTLLTLPENYMVGRYGQLYFQPLAVKEQWLNPDNRIPQHALTIDYVEIAPPALTSQLLKEGTLFGSGGWIVWSTDPPDGTSHGDPTDLYPTFHHLLASQQSFAEALYDDDGT